jgi:hypothetical protein
MSHAYPKKEGILFSDQASLFQGELTHAPVRKLSKKAARRQLLTEEELQRQKKFEKFVRKQLSNFRPTKRDFSIIDLVYRHRFMNSDHIRALIPGSNQKITRRLQQLFHAAYLDRPQAQRGRTGNHPLVYGLGNKGAELIAEAYGISLSAVDWTSKNRDAKSWFLDHALIVS